MTTTHKSSGKNTVGLNKKDLFRLFCYTESSEVVSGAQAEEMWLVCVVRIQISYRT